MNLPQRLLSAWRRPWTALTRPAAASRTARRTRRAQAPAEADDAGFAPTQPAVLHCESPWPRPAPR